MSQPSHSDIAQRAHQIWESEGRPHGRDRDHWHRAEREILGADKAKDARPADLRGAEQNSRQTEAVALGRPGHPTAPSMTQAAASTTKRTQQAAPGAQPASKSAQSQAGEPAGNKGQQSSGGGEPQSGEKSQNSGARRPRAPRQSNP